MIFIYFLCCYLFSNFAYNFSLTITYSCYVMIFVIVLVLSCILALFLLIVGCAESLLLRGLFSRCGEPTLQLWHSGFSLQWLLFLQSTVSRVRELQQLWLPGSRAQAKSLWHMCFSCSATCGILAHRPEIKPASPELAGECFTIEPPGKPPILAFWRCLKRSFLLQDANLLHFICFIYLFIFASKCLTSVEFILVKEERYIDRLCFSFMASPVVSTLYVLIQYSN